MTTPTLDKSYGYPRVHQFGRNSQVDTDWQDVWPPGDIYTWPTTSGALVATSDNPNDVIGGSGANTILARGLGDDWKPVEAIIPLAGLAVTTQTSVLFMRVNHTWVATAGTYSDTDKGGNLGNITVSFAGGGPVQAVIPHQSPIALGESEMCRFSVRLKARGFIQNINLQVDSNMPADVILFQRRGADRVSPPFTSKRVVQYWPGVTGVKPIPLVCPLGPFPACTDLWIATRGGAFGATVGAEMELLIVDGDDP